MVGHHHTFAGLDIGDVGHQESDAVLGRRNGNENENEDEDGDEDENENEDEDEDEEREECLTRSLERPCTRI